MLLLLDGTSLVAEMRGVSKAGKTFVAIDVPFPEASNDEYWKTLREHWRLRAANIPLAKKLANPPVARWNSSRPNTLPPWKTSGCPYHPRRLPVIFYTPDRPGNPKVFCGTINTCCIVACCMELLAYVVPAGNRPGARQFQKYLRQKLSDYMFPRASSCS